MTGFPNSQSNPVGAIPVYVTSGDPSSAIADVSTTVGTASSVVLAAFPSRRYLFIQASNPGTGVWFNMTGGPAAFGQPGTIYLGPGQSYESGPVISSGQVRMSASVGSSLVTILEG